MDMNAWKMQLMKGGNTHTVDEIAVKLEAFWKLPLKAVESLND